MLVCVTFLLGTMAGAAFCARCWNNRPLYENGLAYSSFTTAIYCLVILNDLILKTPLENALRATLMENFLLYIIGYAVLFIPLAIIKRLKSRLRSYRVRNAERLMTELPTQLAS